MKFELAFRPKLVEALKSYTRNDLRADLIAGVTVGIIALPLAMAFGIASGVTPHAGIITAVIAGFLISALGGSRVSIGGPTGAFIIIVYGIVTEHGVANLLICTIMAGIMLLLMGAAKLGTVIKYIPYPVTMGFTSGIAVLIFSTQIKDFFGLQVDPVPSEFVDKLAVLAANAGTAQLPTLLLASLSLGLIAFWPDSWRRRVPASVVALLLGTLAVVVLKLPVETIGSKFGGIPQGFPAPDWPALSWETMRALFQPAFTIAMLAAIESLLCCVVADGMIDDRHDSNQELMAQGIANIVSPIFGGICATGAIARTATNVKCGARSPVAGIVHAFTLLAILLVAAPLAKHIPLATLSAVLMVVAYNMGEWHNFSRLRRWPKSDAMVFVTAFSLTILVDLTVAVEVGIVMAAMLFIKQVSEMTRVTALDERSETDIPHQSLNGRSVPHGVMVYRIFGAFFFGAADKLETGLRRAGQEPDVLILRMYEVLSMDASGLNALEDIHEKLRKKNKHLVLCGPHTQPMFLLQKSGFIDLIGLENICGTIDDALARANQLLAEKAAASSK
ncbi:MAG: SulP family inorganic anion transporter [Verrucomicrobiota bacterium]